jgi:hypothetical protein
MVGTGLGSEYSAVLIDGALDFAHGFCEASQTLDCLFDRRSNLAVQVLVIIFTRNADDGIMNANFEVL